jgi:hypothetical protein
MYVCIIECPDQFVHTSINFTDSKINNYISF